MSLIQIISMIVFLFSVFLIFWAMLGYDVSLRIINKIRVKAKTEHTAYKYSVTVMIVAHNEEDVIYDKLVNVIDNNYPKDKIKYLVASDNSTDQTNAIVEKFIKNHEDLDIKLYTSKNHRGKTNAQNEAQKSVDSEILVMTDANAMFKNDTVSELVSSFANDDIKYVCGALRYINTENMTADSESSYWDRELVSRSIESRIKTITAGNGAIYACRNSDYVTFPPIECHDSSMPYYYGMHGQRAIFNENAIAYEKAGENTEDEYKRKVRMNRVILLHIKNGMKAFNVFKHGWFSYFYFGHRTSRYLLWINHLLAFISNVILAVYSDLIFWKIILGAQILFYILGILGRKSKSKLLHMIYYYCITILAQWHGIFNCITGKAKPTWERAESTR